MVAGNRPLGYLGLDVSFLLPQTLKCSCLQVGLIYPRLRLRADLTFTEHLLAVRCYHTRDLRQMRLPRGARSRRLLLQPLAPGPSRVRYTRRDGQRSRCLGTGHFPGWRKLLASTKSTFRKPGRVISASVWGALQPAPTPRLPKGSALRETPLRHRDDPFPRGAPLPTAAARRPTRSPSSPATAAPSPAARARSLPAVRARLPAPLTCRPLSTSPGNPHRAPVRGTPRLRPASGPAQLTSPCGPITAHHRGVSPNRQRSARAGRERSSGRPSWSAGPWLGWLAGALAVGARVRSPPASFQCPQRAFEFLLPEPRTLSPPKDLPDARSAACSRGPVPSQSSPSPASQEPGTQIFRARGPGLGAARAGDRAGVSDHSCETDFLKNTA